MAVMNPSLCPHRHHSHTQLLRSICVCLDLAAMSRADMEGVILAEHEKSIWTRSSSRQALVLPLLG